MAAPASRFCSGYVVQGTYPRNPIEWTEFGTLGRVTLTSLTAATAQEITTINSGGWLKFGFRASAEGLTTAGDIVTIAIESPEGVTYGTAFAMTATSSLEANGVTSSLHEIQSARYVLRAYITPAVGSPTTSCYLNIMGYMLGGSLYATQS